MTLPGTPAAEVHIDDEALRLAAFLSCLHETAPADLRENPVRGVPLATRAKAVEERIERLARSTDVITPTVVGVWRDALATSLCPDRLWLHGDLHPLNVLVRRGRITGIIDWGDVTSGDVATDLAVFWMLFDECAPPKSVLHHAWSPTRCPRVIR